MSAATPNSSPQFSRRPVLSTSSIPANPARSEPYLPPTLLPAHCLSEAEGLYQACPISGTLLPAPPQGSSPRPISNPHSAARPFNRALKPAGQWARGGPSTLAFWPIRDSAWPGSSQSLCSAVPPRRGPAGISLRLPPSLSLPPCDPPLTHCRPSFLPPPPEHQPRSELPPGSLPRRQRSSCCRLAH